MKRLNLAGLQLLIEGAVIEPRLTFARLDEPLDDKKDGDNRKYDEADGPDMFAHVVVRPFYLSKLENLFPRGFPAFF